MSVGRNAQATKRDLGERPMEVATPAGACLGLLGTWARRGAVRLRGDYR